MKQNGVVCQPGPVLLFFIFRFEYLISGPKSYRDFRETGPWPLKFIPVFRLGIGRNYVIIYNKIKLLTKRFLACVASVSVRFRSKERGTRVTENPLPRSLFAPKPNGNACYAGQYFLCLEPGIALRELRQNLFQLHNVQAMYT